MHACLTCPSITLKSKCLDLQKPDTCNLENVAKQHIPVLQWEPSLCQTFVELRRWIDSQPVKEGSYIK